MKDFKRLIAGLCLVVFVLVCSTVANAAEPKLDDNWHFLLIPYIWLPTIDGSMSTNPSGSGGGSVDFNAGDYLDNLSFAAMLTVEAQKGRWSVISDFMYVGFSNDDTTTKYPNLPGGGIEVKTETELHAWVFEIAPAYSLYLDESTRFDLLAGLRYIHLDAEATLDPSTSLPIAIPSRNIKQNKDIFDPIVGFKGKFELGKGWFLPFYADIGGFGVNNEFTWQVFGGIGYHFSKLFSMVLGYRHLEYDFDDDEPIKDLYMTGGQLGFVFKF